MTDIALSVFLPFLCNHKIALQCFMLHLDAPFYASSPRSPQILTTGLRTRVLCGASGLAQIDLRINKALRFDSEVSWGGGSVMASPCSTCDMGKDSGLGLPLWQLL